jgi:hypothetical protein
MSIEELEALIELAQRGAISQAEKLFIRAIQAAVEAQKKRPESEQPKVS